MGGYSNLLLRKGKWSRDTCGVEFEFIVTAVVPELGPVTKGLMSGKMRLPTHTKVVCTNTILLRS